MRECEIFRSQIAALRAELEAEREKTRTLTRLLQTFVAGVVLSEFETGKLCCESCEWRKLGWRSAEAWCYMFMEQPKHNFCAQFKPAG